MIDSRSLRVMLIMTRLHHGSERVIMEQLRRNKMGLPSRGTLQSVMKGLVASGALRHDNVGKEYVVDEERAVTWVRRVGESIEEQRLMVDEMDRILSHVEDHLLMKGSPLYSWVSIKQERKKTEGR